MLEVVSRTEKHVETDVIGTEAPEIDAGVATSEANTEFEAPNVDAASEPAAAGVDPWDSLREKGYDPSQLEKSYTRFTQELESVKEMGRELEPYKQLKEYMDSNPDVLEALEQVLTAPKAGESEIDVVKREMTMLQRQIATEKELEAVKKYAADNGFPDVDEQTLIQHAIKANVGNLTTAYRDMHFDAIREAERNKAFDEVKGVQKAKAVTQTASPTASAKSFSQADIAAMSPQEFEANRAAILEYYSNRS
jgi:predicted DNA binding CopG/RHH family protein